MSPEVVNATFVADAWAAARRDLRLACADPERERMGAVVNQAFKVLRALGLVVESRV